jgi:hypothetical protein
MMSIDALEISFLLNFKIYFKKTHVICYVCLISVGIEPLFYQLSYDVKCFYNLQFFCFWCYVLRWRYCLFFALKLKLMTSYPVTLTVKKFMWGFLLKKIYYTTKHTKKSWGNWDFKPKIIVRKVNFTFKPFAMECAPLRRRWFQDKFRWIKPTLDAEI